MAYFDWSNKIIASPRFFFCRRRTPQSNRRGPLFFWRPQNYTLAKVQVPCSQTSRQEACIAHKRAGISKRIINRLGHEKAQTNPKIPRIEKTHAIALARTLRASRVLPSPPAPAGLVVVAPTTASALPLASSPTAAAAAGAGAAAGAAAVLAPEIAAQMSSSISDAVGGSTSTGGAALFGCLRGADEGAPVGYTPETRTRNEEVQQQPKGQEVQQESTRSCLRLQSRCGAQLLGVRVTYMYVYSTVLKRLRLWRRHGSSDPLMQPSYNFWRAND